VNDLIFLSPALTLRIKALGQASTAILGRPSTAVRQADHFIAGLDVDRVKARGAIVPIADHFIAGLDVDRVKARGAIVPIADQLARKLEEATRRAR
jgi:hypothetical protein